MRLSVLLAAFMLAATWMSGTSTAEAGHAYFANPHPLMNHINRCLGIGWSDGYHAYGNRDSWTIGGHGYSTHRPNQAIIWPATTTPVMSHAQPPNAEWLPAPTPARRAPR